jgi:hypothetical protein
MFVNSFADGKGQIECDRSCKNNDTISAFLTSGEPGCGGTNIIPKEEQNKPTIELN